MNQVTPARLENLNAVAGLFAPFVEVKGKPRWTQVQHAFTEALTTTSTDQWDRRLVQTLVEVRF